MDTNQLLIQMKLSSDDVKVPTKAHTTDAGWDLYANDDGRDVFSDLLVDGTRTYLYTEYDTGISIELPEGYHSEIVPRSSITNMNLILKNHIGIIDNSYRGTIRCRFYKLDRDIVTNVYKKGDRIAQLIVRKTIQMPIMVVDELSDTKRSEGGFGSSGK